MATNARDLLAHKNYRDTNGDREKIAQVIRKVKQGCPSRNPYYVPTPLCLFKQSFDRVYMLGLIIIAICLWKKKRFYFFVDTNDKFALFTEVCFFKIW